jgi:hypothetical protein
VSGCHYVLPFALLIPQNVGHNLDFSLSDKPTSMKIEIGEVFSIKTKKGFGFFQYVGDSTSNAQIIRVLEPIKETLELTQSEINFHERFIIEFPLKAAFNRKIVGKISKFDLPDSFEIPSKSRSRHTVQGEFLGWFIVDNKSLQRELKRELSENDLKLSPNGIFNDTLLIDYLDKDWRLDNWK